MIQSNSRDGEPSTITPTTNTISSNNNNNNLSMEWLIRKEQELKQKEKELQEREAAAEKFEKELEKKNDQLLLQMKDQTKRKLDLDERELRILEIEEKLAKSTTIASRFKQNEMVKLNVGGTIFATTLNSLLSEKDTFFTAYFSDYFTPKAEEHDHAYFIDRPNANFELILDHFRGSNIRKKLEMLNERELLEFVDEVVYYQVTNYENTGGYYLKIGNGRLFSPTKRNSPYIGEQIRENSVVKVVLKENKISFIVNDKAYGKAFDVPSRDNLFPVLLIQDDDCEVELLP
ncbi:hypothetical protein FDP41_009364 [Naegleria fowleri]|uniref:Potassium channel tetramerisation-type BTB domain-containing protein n=1 Tax=Naegleria fowleri TaxID=5763 RepID=A0A6A5BCS6_NAEFO|nr:uncharacterized protein FDP41_009364 [Naegleria fowleri]KAF0972461.1 hypothetical protein FDP41_009364 [Naegleria fowleri]